MSCCCDWASSVARDHATRLAAIARREGISPADALDVVQDAFHTLLARPGATELPATDALRLLSTIVRNAARNLRRRHYRARPHVELDATLASDIPPPDAALARAVEAAQLGGCMARLGDAYRHVITLRILEELSSEETARELGLTPGHVAVLLHRARKALAECMLASEN